MSNGFDTPTFVLRWWHVVGSLITTLVIIGILYGQISARLASHDDQLRKLDDDSVTRQEFQEMREDLKQRLDRIERKIDLENDMRGLEPVTPPRRR